MANSGQPPFLYALAFHQTLIDMSCLDSVVPMKPFGVRCCVGGTGGDFKRISACELEDTMLVSCPM